MGWFADLAANQTAAQHEHLPSMAEEEEEHVAVPQIHVDAENDPMHDIDLSVGKLLQSACFVAAQLIAILQSIARVRCTHMRVSGRKIYVSRKHCLFVLLLTHICHSLR